VRRFAKMVGYQVVWEQISSSSQWGRYEKVNGDEWKKGMVGHAW
jgi:hypothetical protein